MCLEAYAPRTPVGSSLAADLRDELSKLVEPLATAARVPDGGPLLLALVGQTADAADEPGLRTALDRLAQASADLMALDEASLGGWEGIARILQAADESIGAVRAVESAVQDPALASRLADLGEQLGGQLIGLYLRRYHPRVLWVASL